MGYNFQKILYSFLCISILSWQAVQRLVKCRIMWHFIWVFTVCKIPIKGYLATKGLGVTYDFF